ncbi:Protein of unknown function [Bacillus toyonensis]|jgi:hypothetical protein
MKYK